MKKRVFLSVLLLTSGAAIACSEQGAFGVEFGKPVPASASKQQRDGGSVRNAMGFFDGEVPEPMPGFQQAYGANRDRAFIYAVEAKRTFFDLTGMLSPNSEYKAAVQAAITEIAQLKADWEKKFGLVFEKDDDDGRGWTADGGAFTARVYIFAGVIHLECSNKKLSNKAFSRAMSSM